ncbi:hypothetical protein MTO96_025659 [Rhipicephalus appendiculatus]
MAVQNVDWRSPREGGMGMSMPVRLFDARAEEQKEQQHLEAIHSLGEDLQSLGTFDFAAILLAAGGAVSGHKAWACACGEIQLSQEEARDLELNSRQQRLSERWRHARANRLTASTFGQVVRRQAWTEKGLRNLIELKDLTHVRPVQYGIRNENMAKDRSSAPHSLKDSEPEEAKKRKFSLVFGENGEPQLDRDHEYYAQVLGQMALTGCLWGDFVVCSEKWIGIERIWFDRNEWEDMRKKLDAFFFEHMLPHLARR